MGIDERVGILPKQGIRLVGRVEKLLALVAPVTAEDDVHGSA